MSLTRTPCDAATIVLSNVGLIAIPHSIRLSPRGGDFVDFKGNPVPPVLPLRESQLLPPFTRGQPAVGRQRRLAAAFLMHKHH
jgi:hypothetical protein